MHRLALVVCLLSFYAQTQCSERGKTSRTPARGQMVRDLAGLVRSVPLIVVGKVAGIQTGRTTGEGDGRLQFNDVRISVEKRLKGEAPPEVLVEQLAMAGRTVTSEVGPPYRAGERYVLFLRSGEGARYITTAQGRYLLRGARVWPTEPGLVAQKVKDTDEAWFLAEIQASLEGS